MSAIADRPSIHELDQLNEVMADAPLDRERVIDVLCGIEQGLLEHARGLDQAGGLLNDDEKAARMSLAREDERLRHEVSHLLREVSDVRRQANGNGNDEELRSRLAHILAGLRGHRDAEASLVLESVGTEVGSGD